tara:strand:- start:16 stop:666 length:651 start_codon:yes stop_codon:yes gene_type:complete
MKTVRLSENLKRDIITNAENKYNSTNPHKDYPSDGYKVLSDHGIIDKSIRTQEMFKTIWGYNCPLKEVEDVKISSQLTKTDEDGDEYTSEQTFNIPCSPIDVPSFLVDYGTLKLTVEPTDSTLVESMQVQEFNRQRDNKRREQTRKLEDVMDRFSTLNQLIKAAPYIKDLVPQEKITKMHEIDDRTARRKELAEIADNELQDLRETLLEDALLGDD